MHQLVFIALTNDSAVSLRKVSRSPTNIQMMQSDQLCLNIGTCTAFLCTSQQNPHLTGTQLGKQLLFLYFRICIVNEGNFVFRDAAFNQLGFHIIVYIEFTVCFRSRGVAEDNLCQPVIGGFIPDIKDFLYAGINLAVRVIRQQRIHQTLIQSDFASV